ncbi:FAD/NAD(P)-binding protein [Streptomyces sp. NPDC006552]|uniref:FAD/NAD(P)-binding protein n=1 Tax=Streptomyces sp. NPDC006552 TaxID=3157179 RepID=UPI0033A1527E
MNTPPLPRSVAVVGAGAAGVLASAQLISASAAYGLALDLHLIDPAPLTGAGPAYGTPDDRHLLNVPAGRMSALPDDPDHFLRWLAPRHPAVRAGDFVPRRAYGRYLHDVLTQAARAHPAARLHRVRDRVIRLRHQHGATALGLASGDDVRVDAVVLALGGAAPSADWAGPALRASPRFLADPWAPGALDTVGASGDVLLVGTGLTMVDVAVTLGSPRRVLHAVSRHGILPQAHLAHTAPPFAPGPLDASCGLDAVRRAVRRHLAVCRRERGDWRPGLDGLRPLTAALWQQLPAADRLRFLREDLRVWEAHRHRLAPGTAARLHDLLAHGGLRVSAGEVVRGAPRAGGLRVRLDDGWQLDVAAVVNCTGPRADWRRAANPLVDDLLRSGRVRPGPAGLGLDTTPDGLLIPGAGPAAPLWTLGAARRGNLLETTAMPEIRAQAARLASCVLARLAPAPLRRPQDTLHTFA